MKKLLLFAIPAALTLVLTTNVSAADGKAVYTQHCAKCHGKDGKGHTKIGKILGVRDYTDPAVQAAFTDEQAVKSIKEGMKKGSKTLMRPSHLSDSDIKAVVQYIRTFKKK